MLFYVIGNSYHIKRSARIALRRLGSMSQKRPAAGGESCGQDSFVLEEGHAQINRIFVFLYGGRHVDHLVYREYRRACHSDWCLAADRLPAILLWIGIKKKDKKRRIKKEG